MDRGGREALLDHLLNFDLSSIDLWTVPKTAALFEQKVQSMTPLQAWWLSTLEHGTLPGGCVNRNPNACPVGALFRGYLRHTNQLSDRRQRSAETTFGMFMKRQVPGATVWRKAQRTL